MTDAKSLIASLRDEGLTIGVAESLTGGLVVAELVSVPGASAVVRGGVVAYETAVKHSLLGVSEILLRDEGAVHPEVAAQMAQGVRTALAVDGRPADVGVATTGVAGPEPQDGKPVGTVFVAVARGSDVEVTALHLSGDREAIRRATVSESLAAVGRMLSRPRE